jgi:hypothetical protein
MWCIDCISFTVDRDQWRDIVNMGMNLWSQYNFGNFLCSAIIGGFSCRFQLHVFRSSWFL